MDLFHYSHRVYHVSITRRQLRDLAVKFAAVEFGAQRRLGQTRKQPSALLASFESRLKTSVGVDRRRELWPGAVDLDDDDRREMLRSQPGISYLGTVPWALEELALWYDDPDLADDEQVWPGSGDWYEARACRHDEADAALHTLTNYYLLEGDLKQAKWLIRLAHEARVRASAERRSRALKERLPRREGAGVRLDPATSMAYGLDRRLREVPKRWVLIAQLLSDFCDCSASPELCRKRVHEFKRRRERAALAGRCLGVQTRHELSTA